MHISWVLFNHSPRWKCKIHGTPFSAPGLILAQSTSVTMLVYFNQQLTQ